MSGKGARFYQVTGQSSEAAAGDRSGSRHEQSASMVEGHPVAAPHSQPPIGRDGHPATLHSMVMGNRAIDSTSLDTVPRGSADTALTARVGRLLTKP